MPDEVAPKKRGRPRKTPPDLSEDAIKKLVEDKKRGSTFPTVIEGSAAPTEISGMLNAVMRWWDRPIVKSDDECAERLDDFFKVLAETGELPTVEKMCLALGTIRSTVWNWENGIGCSPARQQMIKKAKEMLAAMDAELVSRRKIPETTYIFRSKNYHGLKDQTDVVVTPNNPIGAVLPEDELRKRIEGDVVLDPGVIDVDL